MTGQLDTTLRSYQYDPLDRVVSCDLLTRNSVKRFYRKSRLATEMQDQVQYSVFEYESQLLAQQQHQAGGIDSSLLATDLQRSVLHTVGPGQHQRAVYSVYGHRSPESGLASLLGFNGERRDSVTGHYLLGNGYRAFNAVLMRFNGPDSLSPFGAGGVNAYAYCAGDPANRVDPQGRSFVPAHLQRFANRIGRGLQNGVDALRKLRPSAQATARRTRINDERLASISEVEKIKNHITESPPFSKTKDHIKAKKDAINNFIGPRDLENGPTDDFAKLLEDEALANVTLKRAMADQQKLQLAEQRMHSAVRKWQDETGFGREDLSRITQSVMSLRSKT